MLSPRDCPSLPCPVSMSGVATSKTLTDLKALLNKPAFPAQACREIVAKFPASHARNACSEVLFYLLHQNLEYFQWDTKIKRQFLTILHEHPSAAEKADMFGFLPLHYLLEAVEADLELVYHLVMVAPKTVSVSVTTSFGTFNCLQLALMRSEVDYKLVMMMLSCSPELASVPTSAGKYPLHLALSHYLANPDTDDQDFFLRVIKKLLVLYPQAVSMEVTEELRCMRLRISPQGEEQQAAGTMQVQRSTWTPIDKVRACRHDKLKMLFEKFLEAFSWRRLHAQWRLH